jgi:hypothetical protein
MTAQNVPANLRKLALAVGLALAFVLGTGAAPTDASNPELGAGTARFVDHGGPVLNKADVYLLYWGNTWTATRTSYPTPEQITAAITTLIGGPYLSGLAQYRGIKPAVLRGSTAVTSSDPPPAFTDEQVGDFLDTQLDAGLAPEPDRDHQPLYIVVLPPGAYAGGDSHFVGEHTYYKRHGQRIPFAWTAASDSLATATQTITHELVEAITDPEGSAILGVAGTCRQNGWCEIADICPDPRIVDGVTAEPYWSNLAGACIAPDRASASAVPDTYASRGPRRSS